MHDGTINRIVRDVRIEDSEYIASLMGQLGYPQDAAFAIEQMKTYMACTKSFVLVIEDAGQVIGFVSFHATPLFHEAGYLGRITAMCVDELSRRSGVGSLLLEELEARAGEMGCTRIEVCSGDRRKSEAHTFYQSSGYVLNCRRFVKILN